MKLNEPSQKAKTITLLELTDQQINELVAKAQGWEWWYDGRPTTQAGHWYNPLTNWQHTGPLIEKFTLTISPINYDEAGNPARWQVIAWKNYHQSEGIDINIKRAICLAIIASVFGEEIDV